MDRAIFGIVGAVISGAAGFYYLYTIFWGKTRPQRISWGVWSLIGILGAGSAIQGGAHAGAYVALTYLVGQVLTFLISLSPKYGKPGGEWYDYLLGLIAVIAILVWQLAHLSPSFAATIAVAADAIVLWLTLRGSWQQPETESLAAWLADGVAAIIAIAALASFSYPAAAYPIYLAVGNSAVAGVLIIRKLQPRQTKKKTKS